MVKNLPAVQETWVSFWVGKSPWRRSWQPTAVFLPGESPWSEEPGRLRSMGLQKATTKQLNTYGNKNRSSGQKTNKKIETS